ncbi:MAG: glycosyltransferase [Bacteroidota bacterium]
MKIVMFYHSLISDWNHGNAHFLRGVVTELQERGHRVEVYEPRLGWSLQNLFAARGAEPIIGFQKAYPGLESTLYDLGSLNLDWALHDADLVIAHEWNDPELIARLGSHHARSSGPSHHYRLLFHDTHHRCVTDPGSLEQFDLTHYDGVLAFGNIVRELYLQHGWTRRAWTWHEAADVRVFHPNYDTPPQGDLVWVGNWGDEERTSELREFLIEPVKELKLKARLYGVRYPQHAVEALRKADIGYGGWLPNYEAPQVFAGYKATVHIPRRPYVRALPGIPTIRVFEAMACGIPLVCSPWEDREHLFTPGEDFLMARNKREMKGYLRDLMADETLRRSLSKRAVKTIRTRHTCGHRVDQLLEICAELGISGGKEEMSATHTLHEARA